jgi:FkbM family methyltransferase
VNLLRLKLTAVGEILRHFQNPLLVLLMRLGLLKVPLFLYRIAKGPLHYAMLARPTSNSMADLFVLREVFVQETYQDILPLIEKKPIRVVDVGGNIGSFTVWLSRNRSLESGYCFEPDPTSFSLCRYNLSGNGCAFVDVIPKAVGGKSRKISMRVNTNRPGGNTIYAEPRGTRTDGEEAVVEVIAFGEWLRTLQGDFDVLKLDCEGAEWEIVDETPTDAWRRFAIIVAEIHEEPSCRHTPDDFPKLMQARGFETIRWDGGHMGLYIGRRR